MKIILLEDNERLAEDKLDFLGSHGFVVEKASCVKSSFWLRIKLT